MIKNRLGGIKVSEGRAHLSPSCRGAESSLTSFCARLAGNKINIALLTHVGNNTKGYCNTALCTESIDAFPSYSFSRLDHRHDKSVQMQPNINIVSIFPHGQRPSVAGAILELLAREDVRPKGLASSPSALSIIISSNDMKKVIDGLFDVFELPAYPSPSDWHAAYQLREKLSKEVSCSWQEHVIKVYNIDHQLELDLWTVALPLSQLDNLGQALMTMDRLAASMPFLVMQPRPEERLLFAFCFASAHREQAMQVLGLYLADFDLFVHFPVAAFFLTGPHFGDRHSIISTLVSDLHGAALRPLAVSCAVSSISFVIWASHVEKTMQAMDAHFQIPAARV
jgi:aspartokinase